MRIFENNSLLSEAMMTFCHNTIQHPETIGNVMNFIDYYDSFSEDVRIPVLEYILNEDKTKEVLNSSAKDAIVRDLKTFLPTHIVKKGMRDTTRARHFVAAARLDLETVLPLLPQCEKALSDFKFDALDLAFVRAHFAPLSDKIKLQCVLLATRDYKKCNLTENIASLNTIFEVFDTLSLKIQKQMVKLVMNILDHHFMDLPRQLYCEKVEHLLTIIKPHAALLAEFPGIHEDALVSVDGMSEMLVQCGLGNKNHIEMQSYNTRGAEYIGYFNYALGNGNKIIHPDYFFKYPLPGAPTFEDIMLMGLYTHGHLNTYLFAHMKSQPKIAELIACLRLLNLDYFGLYELDDLYAPLAFLEEKYHFPLRERFQTILLEKFTFSNKRVKEIVGTNPVNQFNNYHQILWGNTNTNIEVSSKVISIIDDLILHIVPTEKLEVINTENIILGTIHPLNFGADVAIRQYNAEKNFFVERENVFGLKVSDVDEARKNIRDSLDVLHKLLMDEALHMGFTDEEMSLYF